MRRFRAWGPAAACASALLLTAAPATAAPQTAAQAFAELNAWRAQANLPSLTTLDAGWSSACAQHVDYMRLHGGVTHIQTPGAPGYTETGAAAGRGSVLFQSTNVS